MLDFWFEKCVNKLFLEILFLKVLKLCKMAHCHLKCKFRWNVVSQAMESGLNNPSVTYEIIFVSFVDLVNCANNSVNISEDSVPDSFDGI